MTRTDLYGAAVTFLVVAGSVLTFGVLFPLWQARERDACETRAARSQAHALEVLGTFPYRAEAYARALSDIEYNYQMDLTRCNHAD